MLKVDNIIPLWRVVIPNIDKLGSHLTLVVDVYEFIPKCGSFIL